MNGRMAMVTATVVMAALSCVPGCGDGSPEQRGERDGESASTPTVRIDPAGAVMPVWRGDVAMTGVMAGPVTDRLKLRWVYETGRPVYSSAVLAEGAAYIGSLDQALHAIDLATGERRWRFGAGGSVEAAPTYHEGVVYFGCNDDTIYAVDAASGEKRWQRKLGDKISGSIAIFEKTDGQRLVISGCDDGFLYALDASNGGPVWRYGTESYLYGSPAIDGDTVVMGGCDGYLHVVDAATGKELDRIEVVGRIASAVAVADDVAYTGMVGEERTDFVALDLTAGEVTWAFQNGDHEYRSSPAVTQTQVIVGCRDEHVYALDRATGQKRWAFETGGDVDSSPIVVGDRVLVGSDDGRLYLLAADDGAMVWRYDLGEDIASSPVAAGGLVVVGCDDGKVYCFEIAPE